MSWIGALKFWNKEKGPIVTDTANVYMLPRKGTEEYKEVKAVQQGEEMPAKKKEREERNKATMDKALGQLRQVESETKARNEARKQPQRQPRLIGRKVGGRHMTDIPGLTLSDDDVTKLFADLQKDVDEASRDDVEEGTMTLWPKLKSGDYVQIRRQFIRDDEIMYLIKKIDNRTWSIGEDPGDKVKPLVKGQLILNDKGDWFEYKGERDIRASVYAVNGFLKSNVNAESKSEQELKKIVRKWAKENKRSLIGINKVSKKGLISYIRDKNIPVN
jgi:hypothetical protein